MIQTAQNPLILTLSINKEAFEFFTALRDLHFPPERNFLKAHLTLFHKLPMQEEYIVASLTEISKGLAPFQLEVEGLQNLGRGVAFKIKSKELQEIHRNLQHKWASFLSPQDQQKRQPHITIQNKVDPSIARQLLESLQKDFLPFAITGTGFQLWEYLEGPWKLYRTFHFTH